MSFGDVSRLGASGRVGAEDHMIRDYNINGIP